MLTIFETDAASGLADWISLTGHVPEVVWLVALNRETILADFDLNAATTLLVVKVANNGDARDEQANEQIKHVAIHCVLPVCSPGCGLSAGNGAVLSSVATLLVAMQGPAGYFPRKTSFTPPMAF